METVKHGYVPKDTVEFGPKAAAKLTAAAQELAFLLDRGYDTKSASTFVGNHHLLSERQRLALARITSPRAALEERERKRLREAPTALVLDGFNTVITLEVALSGSLLLEVMDGTIRDLAGLRGSYRIVDKTVRAVELLLARLETLGVKEALFNSGRCCWTRRRSGMSRCRWSYTPTRTAFSPAWGTSSPPMPSSWTSTAAGTI